MKKLLILPLFILVGTSLRGQDYTTYDMMEVESRMNMGLGIGLDYGGIGARVTFLPVKRLNVFAAAGYAFVGFGYNVGAQLRITPDNRVSPTVGVMYGYNAVIKVQNAARFDKIYYGTSLSAGLEIHFKGNHNYLNVALVVPFRSKTFYDDWDKVKQQTSIIVQSNPLPVAISIGYHFALK